MGSPMQSHELGEVFENTAHQQDANSIPNKKDKKPYIVYIYLDQRLKDKVHPNVVQKIRPIILQILQESIKNIKQNKNKQSYVVQQNQNFSDEEFFDQLTLTKRTLNNHTQQNLIEYAKTNKKKKNKSEKNLCFNNFQIFNRQNLFKEESPIQKFRNKLPSLQLDNLASLSNSQVPDEVCQDTGQKEIFYGNDSRMRIHTMDLTQNLNQNTTPVQIKSQPLAKYASINSNNKSNPVSRLIERRYQKKLSQEVFSQRDQISENQNQMQFNIYNDVNKNNVSRDELIFQNLPLKQNVQITPSPLQQSPLSSGNLFRPQAYTAQFTPQAYQIDLKKVQKNINLQLNRKTKVPNLFNENHGFNSIKLNHSIPFFINQYKEDQIQNTPENLYLQQIQNKNSNKNSNKKQSGFISKNTSKKLF